MVLPSMRLDDKIALVTGAGSGIGLAIALAVAEAGANCVVTELPQKLSSLDPLCSTVAEIGRARLRCP